MFKNFGRGDFIFSLMVAYFFTWFNALNNLKSFLSFDNRLLIVSVTTVKIAIIIEIIKHIKLFKYKPTAKSMPAIINNHIDTSGL